MNRAQHMVGGTVASTGTYLWMKKTFQEEPTLEGFLLSLGTGIVIGTLPDILEPATSGHHRAFFHSATFATLGGYLLYKLVKNGNIENELKIIGGVLSSAYGSHLLLDMTTPRGLPL